MFDDNGQKQYDRVATDIIEKYSHAEEMSFYNFNKIKNKQQLLLDNKASESLQKEEQPSSTYSLSIEKPVIRIMERPKSVMNPTRKNQLLRLNTLVAQSDSLKVKASRLAQDSAKLRETISLI